MLNPTNAQLNNLSPPPTVSAQNGSCSSFSSFGSFYGFSRTHHFFPLARLTTFVWSGVTFCPTLCFLHPSLLRRFRRLYFTYAPYFIFFSVCVLLDFSNFFYNSTHIFTRSSFFTEFHCSYPLTYLSFWPPCMGTLAIFDWYF